MLVIARPKILKTYGYKARKGLAGENWCKITTNNPDFLISGVKIGLFLFDCSLC